MDQGTENRICFLGSPHRPFLLLHGRRMGYPASLCPPPPNSIGGYVFITNMLPLHAFILILMGRYSSRLYVAYSTYYALGTLASMQIPFVGFMPVRTSEHMAALGIFGLLQLIAFTQFVRSLLPTKQFSLLLRVFLITIFLVSLAALILLTLTGTIAPWTGRFYSLWDTGYAKIHIPIIASVSEHQPTPWPSYFFDLSWLIWLFPGGVWLCFQKLGDEHVFVIVYAVMASYFSGVMVRLMLTLTPVVCVCGGIVVSDVLSTYLDARRPVAEESTEGGRQRKVSGETNVSASGNGEFAVGDGLTVGIFHLASKTVVVLSFAYYLALFVRHSTYVTSTAYSSPSVVLASRLADGSQYIIDDYREAYYWLRMNTPDDARVMSWSTHSLSPVYADNRWDYGYQIAGMADRTTLVDNNTWNNTHIAVPRSGPPSVLMVDRRESNVKSRRSVVSNSIET